MAFHDQSATFLFAKQLLRDLDPAQPVAGVIWLECVAQLATARLLAGSPYNDKRGPRDEH